MSNRQYTAVLSRPMSASMEPSRSEATASKATAQHEGLLQYTAALPNLLAGAGAVIAGARTKSRKLGRYAPQVKAVGNRPPASGFLPEPFKHAAERSLAAYLGKKPPCYHLELTEREYLHVRLAVESDRNATYKAIRKGLCSPDDLKGSNSLWRKLEAIQVQRMGYWGKS